MIAMLMLATIGIAAQDKPDFSGRWVLATPQQMGHRYPVGAIGPANTRANNGTRRTDGAVLPRHQH